MNTTIILAGILLILMLIATIIIVANNSMTSTTPSVTAPTLTPTKTTPVVTTTCTTAATPSNFAGSLWRFTKVVAGFGALIIVLGLLISGLGWMKASIDNWTAGGSNDSAGELVTVTPGLYTTVPISENASRVDYAPTELTVVEFLDENGEALPIYKNGQVQYSSLTGPGIDSNISATQSEFRFIRFSGASSSSEYSFMFYQK